MQQEEKETQNQTHQTHQTQKKKKNKPRLTKLSETARKGIREKKYGKGKEEKVTLNESNEDEKSEISKSVAAAT
jgi:hypothetical protein